MKKIIYISLIVVSCVVCGFGQSAVVKPADWKVLTGAQWTGTLSYLDYGTEKKVSIPSNLSISQSKEDKSSWIFRYQYPDEPKADSVQTVTLSRDGKLFDGETVIERTRQADKTLKIVTEKIGTDNDKKASFRFTYLVGKNTFSIRKEVRYEGAAEFFVRNEYSWKR